MSGDSVLACSMVQEISDSLVNSRPARDPLIRFSDEGLGCLLHTTEPKAWETTFQSFQSLLQESSRRLGPSEGLVKAIHDSALLSRLGQLAPILGQDERPEMERVKELFLEILCLLQSMDSSTGLWIPVGRPLGQNSVPILHTLISHERCLDNPAIFILCAEYFQVLDVDEKESLLKTCNTLIDASQAVKHSMQDSDFLVLLLDRFLPYCQNHNSQELCIALIRKLAVVSCSVKHLKRIFSLLSPHHCSVGENEWTEELPEYFDIFLRDLVAIATDSGLGSREFTDYTNRRSELRLSTIPKWPSSAGYALLLWFQFNDMPSVPDSGVVLWSTTNVETNAYLELSVTSRALSLRIKKDKDAEIVLDTVWDSRGWNYIAISHVSPGFWNSPTEVTVIVNGEVLHKGKMDYPDIGGAWEGKIGSRSDRLKNILALDDSRFSGNLGEIIFLSQSIASEELIRMGSAYKKVSDGHILRRQASLTNRSSSYDTVLHIKSSHLEETSYGAFDTTSKGKQFSSSYIRRRRRHNFLESLLSVGGPVALLPLLAWAKTPRKNLGAVRDSVVADRMRLFFDLLISVLERSNKSMSLFTQSNGIGSIQVIISHLQLVEVSVIFMEALIRLRKVRAFA